MGITLNKVWDVYRVIYRSNLSWRDLIVTPPFSRIETCLVHHMVTGKPFPDALMQPRLES